MEQVRTLTPADRQAALALWQARFSDTDPFCGWYFQERFTPALSAGVFEDGRLRSMALGRPVTLRDGGALPAVLVAGVSTEVGFERRGYMKRAMARVEALAAQAGARLLVLRPVDPAIYLPLGFLPYSAVSLAFGTGEAEAAPVAPRACDPAALLACYAAATQGLAACQHRREADMAARLRDVESDGGVCVVLEGARAYALLERPGGDAVEAAARTAADYAALLAALPRGCMAQLPPNAPTGARIPHAMAKALDAAAAFDPANAARRFVPEEY